MKFNKWILMSLLACFCIIFMLAFVMGCGGNSTKDKQVRKIHGQAAVGSFLVEGTTVEIRPAPVDGIPCELITTTVTDSSGNYEADVSKPVTTEGGELSPEQPTGFLIHASGLYSYTDNSGDAMTANVNPYTDTLVRQYYKICNNDIVSLTVDKQIDNVFPTGLFSDGVTAVNIPDSALMLKVVNVMTNVLISSYGLTSMDDFLTAQWSTSIPLDNLLNSSLYPRLSEFLPAEFEYLLTMPDAYTDGKAIQPIVNSPIYVDIWTSKGDTGVVTCNYGSYSYTMTKEPDSVNGNNHFYCQTDTFMQVGGGVNFNFPDGSNGILFIVRP